MFFKLIRKQRNTPNNCTELLIDGELVTEDDDILDEWANHFERLATPNDNSGFETDFFNETEESFDIIKDYVNSMPNDSVQEITAHDVTRAIRKLNTKKASDMDGVGSEHLIHAEEVIAPYLANLYTNMRLLSYVPPQLKKGYIIPLPKKGKNPMIQDNYRGITITSTYSTNFTKILRHHIYVRNSKTSRADCSEASAVVRHQPTQH